MLARGAKKVSALCMQGRQWYHEKVLDHYENPRNVGSLDKGKKNVGTGLVGAPACGDVMKLQIEVSEDGKTITNAVFKVSVFFCRHSAVVRLLLPVLMPLNSSKACNSMTPLTLKTQISLPICDSRLSKCIVQCLLKKPSKKLFPISNSKINAKLSKKYDRAPLPFNHSHFHLLILFHFYFISIFSFFSFNLYLLFSSSIQSVFYFYFELFILILAILIKHSIKTYLSSLFIVN